MVVGDLASKESHWQKLGGEVLNPVPKIHHALSYFFLNNGRRL